MKAEFKNIVFDSIIAALLTKKCDAIISGMNDTPERRKQVDFVDYLKVGQSLMVKKGNPKHISTLASLAGHVVSVQSGTTIARLPRRRVARSSPSRARRRSRSRRSRRTRTRSPR